MKPCHWIALLLCLCCGQADEKCLAPSAVAELQQHNASKHAERALGASHPRDVPDGFAEAGAVQLATRFAGFESKHSESHGPRSRLKDAGWVLDASHPRDVSDGFAVAGAVQLATNFAGFESKHSESHETRTNEKDEATY